jgi:hypothetical protein
LVLPVSLASRVNRFSISGFNRIEIISHLGGPWYSRTSDALESALETFNFVTRLYYRSYCVGGYLVC